MNCCLHKRLGILGVYAYDTQLALKRPFRCHIAHSTPVQRPLRQRSNHTAGLQLGILIPSIVSARVPNPVQQRMNTVCEASKIVCDSGTAVSELQRAPIVAKLIVMRAVHKDSDHATAFRCDMPAL